jgi:hypothetical protein
MSNRFDRKYELLLQIDDNNAIIITNPLRVAFDGVKSTDKKLNELNIQIYNLNREHRNKIIRDAKDKDPQKDKDKKKLTQAEKDAQKEASQRDDTAIYKIVFRAGYDHLETLFTGDILTAYTERSGADFITNVTGQDGLFDFRSSFTSATVKGDVVDTILGDMKRTKKGKISKRKEAIRPKVLVGNSAQLIQEQLFDDEAMFFDDGTLHILKDNEVVTDIAIDINSETGMLQAPTKADKFISAHTLMNPSVRVGGLVNLTSIYAPHYNGIYRVETIKFNGDSDGNEWKMELLLKAGNYEVIK